MKHYSFNKKIVDYVFKKNNIHPDMYSGILAGDDNVLIDIFIDDTDKNSNVIRVGVQNSNTVNVPVNNISDIRHSFRDIAKLYVLAQLISYVPYNSYLRMLDDKDPVIWVYKTNAIKSSFAVIGGESNYNMAINNLNDINNVVMALIYYSERYAFPVISKMMIQVPESSSNYLPENLYKHKYIIVFKDKSYAQTITPS